MKLQEKIYKYTTQSDTPIKKDHEGVSLKHLSDPMAFIEYLNDKKDVYSSIEVFDDTIVDMISNKKLHSVVTELLAH